MSEAPAPWLVIVGAAAVFGASTWLCRTVFAPGDGVVVGSPSGAGMGALAICFGVFFVGAASAHASPPEHPGFWMFLAAYSFASAAWSLTRDVGVLARYDAEGLRVRIWPWRWAGADWADVRRVRRDSGARSFIFELASSRRLKVPRDARGLVELMLAARAAGAPGAAELLGE